jgi:hypothetical protein
MDVDPILVWKRSCSPFPGSDTTAAASEEKFRGLDPRRAETVQKVSLASDFAVEEVCVSQFTDVYLKLCQTFGQRDPNLRDVVTNSVLITFDPAVVKAGICIAHTDR